MTPILYDSDETSFLTGGIAYLADCTSCIVTEERNGVYECEFTYPCFGSLFSEIKEHRYIFATHDESGIGQPFEIYSRSEPINGLVTFYAHHISYKLSNLIVMPFTAGSCSSAMAKIRSHRVGPDLFTYQTDIDSSAEYKSEIPKPIREVLGGSEGSLLDVYGGEYEFDRFNVFLHKQRGEDTNVEIRHGKNLVDFEHQIDNSEAYNAIVPYWYSEGTDDEPSILVTLPEEMIIHDPDAPLMAVPYDMSDQFEEAPTADELRNAATEKFNNEKPWIESENFEINFAALWQTEEYKEYAPLQRVKLCDTVLVYYPAYGIYAVREKIVKTVYNTLLNRYDEITLNELPTTLSGTLSN